MKKLKLTIRSVILLAILAAVAYNLFTGEGAKIKLVRAGKAVGTFKTIDGGTVPEVYKKVAEWVRWMW